MDKQYIIGIDPGKNGGITTIYGDNVVDISKMPSSPELFYQHLIFLGLPRAYSGKLTILIEDVHSMPSDSSKGAFTFGRGLGQLEGVIAAMGLVDSLKRVSPMKWMNYFKLKRDKATETKTQYKNRIKQLASIKSKTKLTLATCDSYLIALYGTKVEESNANTKNKKVETAI